MQKEKKRLGFYSASILIPETSPPVLSEPAQDQEDQDYDLGTGFEVLASGPSRSQRQSQQRRMAWHTQYSSLLEVHTLHEYGMYPLPCILCNKEGVEMVRCRECDGPARACYKRFCLACFAKYHALVNQHHQAEAFLQGRWTLVSLQTQTGESGSLSYKLSDPPTRFTLSGALPPLCATGCAVTPLHLECTVYYINPARSGSSYTLSYTSCPCHCAHTLLALGVMPLTPTRPSIGITLDSMHLLFKVDYAVRMQADGTGGTDVAVQLRYGPAAVELNGLLEFLVDDSRAEHGSLTNMFSEVFVVFSDLFVNSHRNMQHLGVNLPLNVACLPCRERTLAGAPLVSVAVDLQYIGRLNISDETFVDGVDNRFSGTLLSEREITALHSQVTSHTGSVDAQARERKDTERTAKHKRRSQEGELPSLSQSGCGRQFKASESLNGKESEHLKERGFVAAVCGDEVVLHAMESQRHESFILIAMTVWMLITGLGGDHVAKAKFGIKVLFYDVACKIAAYMRYYFTVIMSKVSFLGVGLFHAWAHIPSCQRSFSGIQSTLAGLLDGELAVISFSSKLAHILASMSHCTAQERFFAVTSKFRSSMKYMRKFVWWATLKQVIEETNFQKMRHCVQFNIDKIRLNHKKLQRLQQEYSTQLLSFLDTEEGSGLTAERVSNLYKEDSSFELLEHDIPSYTDLAKYGDLVFALSETKFKFNMPGHTSKQHSALKQTIQNLENKLRKIESKPPRDLQCLLENGRPSPAHPELWKEFVIKWGLDSLRWSAWEILIQRRQILTQRADRKTSHLHLLPQVGKNNKKQNKHKKHASNIQKALKSLGSKIDTWNSVFERVRGFDIAGLVPEVTFSCSPIPIPKNGELEEKQLKLSLGTKLASLDDQIPEHLILYPSLKPIFDLHRDIGRTAEDTRIRTENLSYMMAGRQRDIDAVRCALEALPEKKNQLFSDYVVQSKRSFLQVQLDDLQRVATQEKDLTDAFTEGKLQFTGNKSNRKRKLSHTDQSSVFSSAHVVS